MKHKLGVCLFFFVLVFVMLTACGKKGPPFLPQKQTPFRIQELTAEWKNGTVFFRGRVALFGEEKSAHIKGCRIHHARYPLEKPPCDGCPIDYKGYRETEDMVLRGEDFFCELRMNKKRGVHFFEVRLIGESGDVGPPSNRIKLRIT